MARVECGQDGGEHGKVFDCGWRVGSEPFVMKCALLASCCDGKCLARWACVHGVHELMRYAKSFA